MPRFVTDFKYVDRETKAEYVWLKYNTILKGRILDVGADKRNLKRHLGEEPIYWGIGLGGEPDQQVNLDNANIPFPDGSFDCVLCLDVLEHLENIHDVFDELCRVTKQYVIISLPSPWTDFYQMLRYGEYRPGHPMKFYGLPLERPADRHRWFFSSDEAERFVRYRAEKNRMRIVQLDYESSGNEGGGWRGWVRTAARTLLFRKNLNLHALFAGTMWTVLDKCAPPST